MVAENGDGENGTGTAAPNMLLGKTSNKQQCDCLAGKLRTIFKREKPIMLKPEPKIQVLTWRELISLSFSRASFLIMSFSL